LQPIMKIRPPLLRALENQANIAAQVTSSKQLLLLQQFIGNPSF